VWPRPRRPGGFRPRSRSAAPTAWPKPSRIAWGSSTSAKARPRLTTICPRKPSRSTFPRAILPTSRPASSSGAAASPRTPPPNDWLPVFDAQNLIYAGANKAGNDRPTQWHRIGLILDAAHNLRKQYEINPDRVYTGGLSGGGGQACIAALYHPDVFRGSFLMGCPVTFEPGGGASFPTPPKAVYDQAKATQRYVLGAGSDDKLTPPSSVKPVAKNNYRLFKYPAVFFEVPGIGHARPPGEWLEKAFVAMDIPVQGRLLLGRVAKSLEPARAAIDGEQYAAAAKVAKTILDRPASSEEEKRDAQRILEGVLPRMAEDSLKEVQALVDAKECLRALDLLKTLQAQFKGLSGETLARDKEKELMADPAFKKELTALQMLDKVVQQEATLRNNRAKKQLIPTYKSLAAKYPGTAAAARAEERARFLERLSD
jgi:predicted esterase